MILRILLVILLCFIGSPFGVMRISIITPEGQILNVIQQQKSTQNILPFDINFLKETMGLDLFNLFNKQKQTPCNHGQSVNGTCACSPGWAGGNCSIHVHQIDNASLQLLFHQRQYFVLDDSIREIKLDWSMNKVFLVNSQGEEIKQIDQNTRFIQPNEHTVKEGKRMYKIIGSIGSLIEFTCQQANCFNYLYLLIICPAVIATVIYLIKKFKPKRKSKGYIKFTLLRNTEECSICLMNEPIGEKVRLNCQHFFHLHCISDWLEYNKTCPICRSDIDITNYD